ncbi:DUF6758 family protein [Allorhizocola rhizosphaerae]|uniref:DUF6758 family protein n=1 Tax=Allorhizocola rhizosphaerae TaxID=1872709 RepID=UPI000E3CD6F8|nr:DUF6758 family protein [Allorhizocola rhizosphaerae]
MSLAVSCPRCGGPVRPPGLTHSQWLCDSCGPVLPLHTASRVNREVVASAVERAKRDGMPMWCPWPMPPGWMVTGLGWVADDRSRVAATAVACTGPTPLGDGPADVVLVAEEPGVGLGARMAGLPGQPDLGPDIAGAGSHAKVKAAGHPTPLWSVEVPPDRSVYAGEAKGRWIYAIAWPAHAGYFFAENPVLHDLAEWLPAELVFGAPSPRLSSST